MTTPPVGYRPGAPLTDNIAEARRRSPDEQIPGRATFALEGMTCASCASRIEKALGKVAGVTSAGVNLATSMATVEGDVAWGALFTAVDKAGYTAVDPRPPPGSARTFRVEGMTCAS